MNHSARTRRIRRPSGATGAPHADGAADEAPLVLQSCHSTWLFDRHRRRFRRVLKGLDLGAREASTEWRAYHTFDLDEASGRFVVILNPEGNRVIRSRRHTEPCPDCGTDATSELSLEEILSLVDA